MREDLGIATLIDLHDQIIDQGDGYWVKIEAWVVLASKDIPHGRGGCKGDINVLSA